MYRFIRIIIPVILWLGACKSVDTPTPSGSAMPYPQELERFRVMFYNVENLFDIYDDEGKHDDDFLPGGRYGWNIHRYNEKLRNISKVVMNMGWDPAQIITLCEIENRGVLEDLINKTPLSGFGYEIIHEESPDRRGIDVALLYRRDYFEPLSHRAIPVKFPFAPQSRTRDILYVTGVAYEDTLHIFVNHWPSKFGGVEVSEPRRQFAGDLVRGIVDSLFEVDPDKKIIVIGDFNDGPDGPSLMNNLVARPDTSGIEHPDLWNAMYNMKINDGRGTQKFRHEWDILDQIIISTGLLFATDRLYTFPEAIEIFDPDWLYMEDHNYPGRRPFRTYIGSRYIGGYSDHFPVYIDLFVKDRLPEN